MKIDGESIARAVLCVRACKGMSDKEVEDIQEVFFGRKAEFDKRVLALKADLDKAVGLLKDAHSAILGAHWQGLPGRIKTFLTRMEARS